MSDIAIYMEGGGKGNATKTALRQGMTGFLKPLKKAARNKELNLKVVVCGPRSEAFKRFRNAVNNSDNAVSVLLVDAEGPVNQSPRLHLRDQDKWNLSFTSEDTIHLMVQTMETWIVADSGTLKSYYGQGFRPQKLPGARNLERVPKTDVESSLGEATKDTQKGRYHKIKHASDLLERIDAEKVKARCCHCRRVFKALGQIVDAA